MSTWYIVNLCGFTCQLEEVQTFGLIVTTAATESNVITYLDDCDGLPSILSVFRSNECFTSLLTHWAFSL